MLLEHVEVGGARAGDAVELPGTAVQAATAMRTTNVTAAVRPTARAGHALFGGSAARIVGLAWADGTEDPQLGVARIGTTRFQSLRTQAQVSS